MTASLKLRSQVLALDNLSLPVVEAWQHLLKRNTDSHWAFLSHSYASAVQRSEAGRVKVVLLWRGEDLVGVLPLQRRQDWLGALGLHEPVGGSMTDYAGLLACEGVVTDWSTLLSGGSIPSLYFTHLDEAQCGYGLAGESPRVGLRTVIHPQGGEVHWRNLRETDKKLVTDTERRERKLQNDHGATIFQIQSATAEEDLAKLIELKCAQYLRTGKHGGPLLKENNVRLLQELLKSNDPECRPLLSTLKVGTRLVAAHFGLQSGRTLHYWFPVYDEAFSTYSPGRILFKHLIHGAAEEGIGVIDRGEGDTSAKRDFATESHHFLKGLVSVGPWGWAIANALRAQWRFAHSSE